MTSLAEAAVATPSRPSWRETFRGVTWGRAGVLLFACSWLSFGSYPTGKAAMARDWVGAITVWIAWSFGLALCYGPPALALVAIANRMRALTSRTVAVVTATVVAGGIYYSAFLWVVYYGPPTGGMNVARFMTMTLEGIAEIGVVGLLLVLLARRDRATRDRRSGASSR